MKNSLTFANGKKVELTAKFNGTNFNAFNDGQAHYEFLIYAKSDAAKISFKFYSSQNDYKNGKTELTESDVLNAFGCFVSDSLAGKEDFESFCSEFGYDTDSRKAHKIWKACVKSGEKFEKLEIGDIYEVSNEINELENI